MKRFARFVVAMVAALLGAFALAIWILHFRESAAGHHVHCTTARVQYETWLLLGQVLAFWAPVGGLPVALLARRARVAGPAAVGLHAVLLLADAAIYLRVLPLGALPCLRD